jgi:hypothetical protein
LNQKSFKKWYMRCTKFYVPFSLAVKEVHGEPFAKVLAVMIDHYDRLSRPKKTGPPMIQRNDPFYFKWEELRQTVGLRAKKIREIQKEMESLGMLTVYPGNHGGGNTKRFYQFHEAQLIRVVNEAEKKYEEKMAMKKSFAMVQKAPLQRVIEPLVNSPNCSDQWSKENLSMVQGVIDQTSETTHSYKQERYIKNYELKNKNQEVENQDFSVKQKAPNGASRAYGPKETSYEEISNKQLNRDKVLNIPPWMENVPINNDNFEDNILNEPVQDDNEVLRYPPWIENVPGFEENHADYGQSDNDFWKPLKEVIAQ